MAADPLAHGARGGNRQGPDLRASLADYGTNLSDGSTWAIREQAALAHCATHHDPGKASGNGIGVGHFQKSCALEHRAGAHKRHR